MWKLGCAIPALMIGTMPAYAQGDPASAQDRGAESRQSRAPQGGEDAGSEDEIVVSGVVPGAVVTDIPAEQELTPADIRSYGVSNVGELITALAPQTSSGRGRGGGGPVILLNGRRISSFSEIRELPSEAILRVDIFPEEVALQYGYRADQRVVNIVLRPRFRAITTELQAGAPTAGGSFNEQASVNVLRINKNGRASFDIGYKGNSGLVESDRDVLPTSNSLFDSAGNISARTAGGEIDPALSALAGQTVSVAGVPGPAANGAPSLADFVPGASQRNVTDTGDDRSLVPASQALTLNAVLSRNISAKTSATINARLDVKHGESLLGRPGVALVLPAANPFSPFSQDVVLSRYVDGLSPLSRDSMSQDAHLGATLNGEVANWRWTFTGNYDRDRSRTSTTTGIDPASMQAMLNAGDPGFNPFAAFPMTALAVRPNDRVTSLSQVASADLLLNGSLFNLPAGKVSTSLRATGRMRDYESEALRGGNPTRSGNSRDEGSVQANIDLPIASRREGFLSAIGDLSINGSAEIEELSDFGSLKTFGYGVHWSPFAKLNLIASWTDEEGAPSAQQLGDPTVFTPNVRVFDYVRGESVDVTTITGGNPNLGGDQRHVFKLGLNARPFSDKDFSFRAEYVNSTTRNQISGFPAASAEVEAAFPQRFLRDASGRLISVDTRPVNFARAEREQFRWGFNFSVPLTSSIEKMVERYREQVQEARAKGEPVPPPPEQLRLRFNQQRRDQGGAGGPAGQGREGAPGQQAQGQQERREGGPPPEGGPRSGSRGGPGGGGRGGFGGGRGGFGGPNGILAGRLQFALFHTVHLTEKVVISDGLPVLDLLDGSATGNRGGQPRHELEAQAGLMKDGLGIRLSGNWQSATHVDGGTAANPQPLRFGTLGTVNLRLFADLGQQLRWSRTRPWMRGMRVSLSIDNIFDTRMKVTDENGVVPLSYQPDLLDPTGRTIRLSIRKLFF